MNKSKIDRMKELNNSLSKAADAYYNTGVEIMSDHEYDTLYDDAGRCGGSGALCLGAW